MHNRITQHSTYNRCEHEPSSEPIRSATDDVADRREYRPGSEASWLKRLVATAVGATEGGETYHIIYTCIHVIYVCTYVYNNNL